MVRKFARLRTLAPLSLFLLLLFLATCTSHPKSIEPSREYAVTEEEKVWLREFFHDLLFEDHGAYVLYGTKPASLSCISQPMTEEEYAQTKLWIESLSAKEKETYKVRTRETYDFYENFQKWEKIKGRFPIRQYLFGKFPSSRDEKTEYLLFLNIEETLRTLLKYYGDFKRVLGYDFDPFQVVFDIENRDSKFWNTVLDNAIPLGILLGYGRDNAYFFKWRVTYGGIKDTQGIFMDSLKRQFYEEPNILYPNPQHFVLPIFASFGLYPNDKQLIDKYKQEQKKIKNLYKGRDEVDVALEWLTR